MSVIVVRLGKSGRVVLPVAARKLMGLRAGDELLLEAGETELRLTTRRLALARAQDVIARRVSPDRSLATELIAERRREAEVG